MMDTNDRDTISASIISCAALLEQHTKIHGLSVATTVATVALLLASVLFSLSPPSLWLGVMASLVLLGLAETWIAIRIGFDQTLLLSITSAPEDLQKLDQALTQLKLMPASKAGRGLYERLHGCIRLLKWQGALLIAQLIVAVAVTVLHRLLV